MPARRSLPQIVPWLLLAAAPVLTFLVMRMNPSLDFEISFPDGHFYIVSVVALITAALGVFASVASLRTPNVRVLLLAMAFVSMAAIFAVHGLSTPGFLVDVQYTALTGVASRLSVTVASTFLAASAIDFPERVQSVIRRWRAWVLGSWIALLALAASVSLWQPQLVPEVLMTDERFANFSFVYVVLLSLFTAHRYFDGFRRSGLPMYGAVALGAALIIQAQVGAHFGTKFHATWWLYHVELLIGFSSILWGLFIEYARGHSPVLAIQGLTLRDPIEQIQAGYTDSITSLAAALEARDGYTLGHGERVAALSVMMGEQLGLPVERLRSIYQGALLHDVGKIAVPDDVLHKPGRLDDEQYATIKKHPGRGESMLAAAFSGGVELAVIRHHHERVDGEGYPDGLAGDAIPLEARIAAVADVYDALRSARSYRPAWAKEKAQQHIVDNVRTHFDPDCVDAFIKVVEQWEDKHAADNAPYRQQRAA